MKNFILLLSIFVTFKPYASEVKFSCRMHFTGPEGSVQSRRFTTTGPSYSGHYSNSIKDYAGKFTIKTKVESESAILEMWNEKTGTHLKLEAPFKYKGEYLGISEPVQNSHPSQMSISCVVKNGPKKRHYHSVGYICFDKMQQIEGYFSTYGEPRSWNAYQLNIELSVFRDIITLTQEQIGQLPKKVEGIFWGVPTENRPLSTNRIECRQTPEF